MYQFFVATSVMRLSPNRRKIHCTRLSIAVVEHNRYRPKKSDVRITTTVVA